MENTKKIEITTDIEHKNCSLGPQKLWSMVQLKVSNNQTDNNNTTNSINITNSTNQYTTPVDIVVVLDRSSSMRMDSKLSFVKTTIDYLIKQLNKHQRLGMIQFNQEADPLTDGLVEMTEEGKAMTLSKLEGITPEGSTNISNAFFSAVGMLKDRDETTKDRMSVILFLTDGLSNAGLRANTFRAALDITEYPKGLTIHTFGYGNDHDSRCLTDICQSTKGGMYHFIEKPDNVASVFGECISGILNTVLYDVKVRFVASDGTRIVNWFTKYPKREAQQLKDCTVFLGSMYTGETKTILYKLSIGRELTNPPTEDMYLEMTKNEALGWKSFERILYNIIVTYRRIEDSQEVQETKTISIQRGRDIPTLFQDAMPKILKWNIDRYKSAVAMEEAVKLSQQKQFAEAQRLIKDVISSIDQADRYIDSTDSGSSVGTDRTGELVDDLNFCIKELCPEASSGSHNVSALSSTHYMERSNGMNLVEPKRRGYITSHQQSGSRMANDHLKTVNYLNIDE